ncbi:hypothetical protein BBP40_007267 [Aspergillus hancockii]|nr:hypothetical protein BBP40_007267 [Aspergillus hancockii]
MNGRFLGSLEPTQAFGDRFLKWTDEMQAKVQKRYLNDGNLGRQLAPNATPSYLTAEPIVTSVQIQPERGDSGVIALDGLWKLLSNEEVVGLVRRWIDEQENIGPGQGRRGWKSCVSAVKSTTGQKRPVSTALTSIFPDGRFVLEDRSSATDLLRNALGGGHLHDGPDGIGMHLTVMVIFFGDVSKNTKDGQHKDSA